MFGRRFGYFADFLEYSGFTTSERDVTYELQLFMNIVDGLFVGNNMALCLILYEVGQLPEFKMEFKMADRNQEVHYSSGTK